MLAKLEYICLTVSRSWITHELCCPKLSTDLPTDYPERSYKELKFDAAINNQMREKTLFQSEATNFYLKCFDNYS